MSEGTLRQTQNMSRLSYIDIAKALALVIVVLFHAQGIQQTMLQRFGAAFHMPVFFFLYGMTTSGGTKLENMRQGVIRRFRSLIVPYVLWVCIYLPMRSLSLKGMLMLLYASNPAIGAAGADSADAVLWFLPTMFVAACLFDLVTFCENRLESDRKRLLLNIGTLVLAAAISFACNKIIMHFPRLSAYRFPLNADVALSGYSFLMTGYLLKKWIGKILRANNSVLLLLAMACWGVTVLLAEWNQVRVVMAIGIYGNYMLFLAAGFAGSVGTVLFAAFCERVMKTGIIAWIGKHSLFVFASHRIVFRVLDQFCVVLGIGQSRGLPGELLYSALAIALCCVCCAATVRYVPALEGK